MQTEQKRKAVKKLGQGYEKRTERKNRQVQELFEKHQAAVKEHGQRKSADKQKQEKDDDDFTEWARNTIDKELAKVDPYSTSTLWRYVLSQFKDYLDQGGTVCAGSGLKFPLPRDEKLFFEGFMQSLEELGFIVHYNQVKNDKYEFFITKY